MRGRRPKADARYCSPSRIWSNAPSWFGVQASGPRVCLDLGFRIQGLGFGNCGFGVQDSGWGARVEG
eukprot:3315855-Rhodomonas_salina.1